MSEKFVGVSIEEEIIEQLKIIAARERRPLKAIHKEILLTYVKEHKEGNPAFTLDQFQDPLMKAVPAVFRNLMDWQEYIDNLTEKGYRDLEPQIQAIKSKMDERWKKGFD